MAPKNVKESMDNEARLDARLEEPQQRFIANQVARLPQEEPSLMWRSSLSERIHEVAQSKAKKRRLAWVLRPALGLGLAGALALAFISTRPSVGPSGFTASTVEEQILSAHRESVQMDAVLGTAAAYDEAPRGDSGAKEYQWDETDLGTL